MSLTEAQIRKVAKLSRIGLSDEEVVHYQKEVSGIIEWMELLKEVDTENVEGMTSVANITLPTRNDEVTDGGIQKEILENAPKSSYGCFVVPKVVE